MKSFARVTKLTDIGGRADYISNPDRQECVVTASESIDWRPYHEYEMAHQKSDTRNNEGREVIVSLPNEWYELEQKELHDRVQRLAVTVSGKATDMQWAVHWNRSYTNLHVHIIFSERTRIADPGRWDRDIYLTEDGRVARKKAERARFEDGTYKPPVHRKGEIKDGFSAKNSDYKKRSWIEGMKSAVREFMISLGVNIEKSGFLHEYHEGKGKDAPLIRKKNEAIRINNGYYDTWLKLFPDLKERSLQKLMIQAAKGGNILLIARMEDQRLGYRMLSLDEWSAAIAREQTIEHQTHEIKDSELLKEAWDEFKECYYKERSIRYDLSECKLWQTDKKKRLHEELSIASKKSEDALNMVFSFGVSKYRDGVKIESHYADIELMEHNVQWVIKDLQNKEKHADRGFTSSEIKEQIQQQRILDLQQSLNRNASRKKKSKEKERD